MELLGYCLESLFSLEYPRANFEVIVIYSGCSSVDPSIQFPHARCFAEAQAGLTRARNLGWQKAQGRYVAYLDDECKVPSAWLQNAKRLVNEISPDIFGGPYYPWYPYGKPHWFKDAYQTGVL